MKKTNIVLAMVIAVFIICATIILVVAFQSNKEDNSVPVDIDFTALSSDIEESTNLDATKMSQITIEDLESF